MLEDVDVLKGQASSSATAIADIAAAASQQKASVDANAAEVEQKLARVAGKDGLAAVSAGRRRSAQMKPKAALPWRRRAEERLAWVASTAQAAPGGKENTLKPEAVLLEAWIGQSSEWTKSVFALSSAAIGLTTQALLSESAPRLDGFTKVCLVTSCLCFSISVLASLETFRSSATLVRHLLKDKTRSPAVDETESKLERLETAQLYGFEFGLGLLVVGTILQRAL